MTPSGPLLSRLSVLLLCGLNLLITAPAHGRENDTANIKEPAATVNGHEISRSDFDNAVLAARRQFAAIGTKSGTAAVNIEEEVLERMIILDLMLQDAEKRGIIISDMDLDGQMAAFRNSFESDVEFNNYLQKNNIDRDTVKKEFSRQMTIKKLQEELLPELGADIKVSSLETETFYKENLDKFSHPEQVRASHILITVKKDAGDDAWNEGLQTIKSIRDRALAGEDFAELARQYSHGPSSAQGGDLGFFARGAMEKNFEETAFSIKPEEISEAVKTRFGYHIIKVLEKKNAGTIPYEEVEDKIERYLTQRKLERAQLDYNQILRKSARITTNI